MLKRFDSDQAVAAAEKEFAQVRRRKKLKRLLLGILMDSSRPDIPTTRKTRSMSISVKS
jgi:hypothetical protein